jgi:hypothetical protein
MKLTNPVASFSSVKVAVRSQSSGVLLAKGAEREFHSQKLNCG